MSPLHVYKASAGSGKTFAITREYLRLLFLQPDMHRHILAVTFTNKAAGEMKQRILARLHALSDSRKSGAQQEMEYLKTITGLDQEAITKKAGALLRAILNEYSRFSVGTIDKFFQSVIRAFTREIGIQPGYNLELDNNRILSLAVDRLFQDISTDQELQQWLIRFAEERLEEARSWNFRNDIIGLGKELFKEAFQNLFLHQDLSILDKKNLDIYQQDLEHSEAAAKKEIIRLGESALGKIEGAGFMVSDFKLKDKSVAALFRTASEGLELNFTESKLQGLQGTEKWVNKNASVKMLNLTSDHLIPLLNEVYSQHVVLNTIFVIRQNFYTLGILSDIWGQVSDYIREKNIFLISDSSRFLKGIIGGNQVPFIYERTGSRFSHIMLDEFQDTSVFQYDNFKPLIDNALAAGSDTLVVGDVKQSIYRWRNSDWKILASDLQEDFRHQDIRINSLDKNYRSRENIIRFNNTVFSLAPEILAQRIDSELSDSALGLQEAQYQVSRFRKAYADAVQKIPEGSGSSGGKVRVEGFEQSEERTFTESALERIPEWIRELQEGGLEPGEIAILVRSRKEGVSVAGKLLEEARRSGEKQMFRLISNESLLLIHNRSVILIISTLKYLLRPTDQLNNSLLKYQLYLCGILSGIEVEGLFDRSIPVEQFLPDLFKDRLRVLRQLPLFELVEYLIDLFSLSNREQDLPYLQAFQDLVIDLNRKEPHGVGDFLHFWEQHGASQGISISEESNAIRILTIHKAKGLEFKAVLVPFCNWEITTDQQKSNILWCTTANTPFSHIPIVPLRFSGKLKQTLFSSDYSRERMKGYMDSLNLMYVAFTRAKDVLMIGTPLREKTAFNDAGDLIRAVLEQEAVSSPALLNLKALRSGNLIQTGEIPASEPKTIRQDLWKFDSYPVDQRSGSLRVRLRSDEYFVDEEGTYSTGLAFGTMMHQVFSKINSPEEVDPLLEKMQKEGLIPVAERKGLQKQILNMISQPGVESWFSPDPKRTIYNERSILCGNGSLLRPDRVIEEEGRMTVVDFKFGSLELPRHMEQVREYMKQIHFMGHLDIVGYVWYVTLGKSIKVELA